MHVKPTGPNRVEQPRLSLRALIPRYTRQFHMKKKQKQIIYISMFIYQMNWPIWKIIATGWMLCRPFEISHFTMFTTFRLSIRKKTTKSNWQIWTHNLFQLNGKWMGREGPTGLWIHVHSAVPTPAVQSIRLPPSVDKQKSQKFFLLSTGTESQQPNQRCEAVNGCTYTSKETFSKFVSSSIAKYLLATPVFFYQFSHLIFSPVFLFVSRIATGRAILPCTIAQRTPIRALPISY